MNKKNSAMSILINFDPELLHFKLPLSILSLQNCFPINKFAIFYQVCLHHNATQLENNHHHQKNFTSLKTLKF